MLGISIHYALSFTILLLLSHSCFAIRPFHFYDDLAYDYGYVNLKLYNNTSLDVTPTKTVVVESRDRCAEECVMQPPPFCQSLNIVKISENVFNCSVLSVDKNSYLYFLNTTAPGVEHYARLTKCDETPRECDGKKLCIPDRYSEYASCQCPSYLQGSDCEAQRTTTPWLFFLPVGSDEPNTKTETDFKELSFATWVQFTDVSKLGTLFYLNAANKSFEIYTTRTTFTQTVNVKLVDDVDDSEIFQRLFTFTVNAWHHVGCTFVVKNESKIHITCYVDGKKEAELEKDGFVRKTVTYKFGANADPPSSIPEMIFAESFLWDHKLIAEDFDLMNKQIQIPPLPVQSLREKNHIFQNYPPTGNVAVSDGRNLPI